MRDIPRQKRLLALLGEALDVPSAERPAWLARLAGADTDLREDLARLLAHESDTEIATGRFGALLGDPDILRAGDTLHEYTVVRPLGQGGMGTVWLAHRTQTATSPHVAIKVPTALSNAHGATERLKREGAILAALNHPNIARLIEVGVTPKGMPFIVIEYVDGMRLPDYCNANRLGIQARLRLFLQVLDAVAYAHAALVLHRDLKPSNVLVSRTGDVKLLDFGIAKLIDDSGKADATQLTQIVGHALTPDYASPEQIAGVALTVATDVYSLGVMLFELLTGARPYQLKRGSVAELEEAILAAETAPPSAAVTADFAKRGGLTTQRLKSTLLGDLDTIVLKALKKNIGERYPTVGALRDDIARYLAGDPVLAQPDSFAYRAGKFVRRHRVPVTATIAVAASLLVGLGAAIWQANLARHEAERARAEAARADQQFDDVRKMANALVFDVHDAVAPIPGATTARKIVVQKALDFLDKLAAQKRDDLGLQRDLASGYLKVGESQHYAQWANLGDLEGASASYAKAVAAGERLMSHPEAGVTERTLFAGISLSHARHLLERGEITEALAANQRGMAIRESAWAAAPRDFDAIRNLGIAQSWRADILHASGDIAAGIALHESALKHFSSLTAIDPNSARARWGVITTHANLGSFWADLKNDVKAREHLTHALTLNQDFLKDRPDHYSVLHGFGHYQHLLGVLDGRAGDVAAAVERFRSALRYRESLAERDAKDAEAASLVLVTRERLGLALLLAGRRREALALLADAQLSKVPQPPVATWKARADEVRHWVRQGEMRAALGDVPASCDSFATAREKKASVIADFKEVKVLASIDVPACPTAPTKNGAGALRR